MGVDQETSQSSQEKCLFHVGNDIVDLTHPRTLNKINDARFISRILTPDEQDRLRRCADPLPILWSCWAAKETAYKICRKLDLRAAFSPRLYPVALRDAGETGKNKYGGLEGRILTGTVSTKCGMVHIRAMIHPEYVHVIGTEEASCLGNIVWETARMKDGEPENHESSFVRRMAVKGLAARVGQRPEDIAIRRLKGARGLGPPAVYIKGNPSAIDISLSHDGPFCAYAFGKSS